MISLLISILIIYSVIYIHIHKYITIKQHGFMARRSSCKNLALFTSELIDSVDRNVDVIYTDFSKAFDKVNISMESDIQVLSVYGIGMLLLYRPKDITSECAFSSHLRYDISFGMGMSDTITLVFRVLKDTDYECLIEIVTSKSQYLLVVVRYPNSMGSNCAVNRDAITVLKRNKCIRLCDLLARDVISPYFIFTVQERLRFLFKSNSSINSDINANFYQITTTSARLEPEWGCNKRNETICIVDKTPFCFTTGVVCDGIKNCGVDDWFDERKSKCSLPVERLDYAPVITVIAVLLCAFIAGGHTLMRCLPSIARAFFIFNANEDNRLCIDPVLVPKGSAPELEAFKRTSIIPVFNSYSSESDVNEEESRVIEMQTLNTVSEGSQKDKEIAFEETPPDNLPEKTELPRKSTMRSMTEKIQDGFKFVTRSVGRRTKTFEA